MSRSIRKNFRGLRALVVMSQGPGRDTLERTLAKLGLVVELDAADADGPGGGINVDLVFFDADEGAGSTLETVDLPDVPRIAIIGSEAPSRLARVVRFGAGSHILKPVRSSGIFTAILLATNEHALRTRREQEAKAMQRRLSGRRVVIRAVLSLMRSRACDEDAAYEWLRREAMARRILVEDMARHVLDVAPDPGRNPRRASRPD